MLGYSDSNKEAGHHDEPVGDPPGPAGAARRRRPARRAPAPVPRPRRHGRPGRRADPRRDPGPAVGHPRRRDQGHRAGRGHQRQVPAAGAGPGEPRADRGRGVAGYGRCTRAPAARRHLAGGARRWTSSARPPPRRTAGSSRTRTARLLLGDDADGAARRRSTSARDRPADRTVAPGSARCGPSRGCSGGPSRARSSPAGSVSAAGLAAAREAGLGERARRDAPRLALLRHVHLQRRDDARQVGPVDRPPLRRAPRRARPRTGCSTSSPPSTSAPSPRCSGSPARRSCSTPTRCSSAPSPCVTCTSRRCTSCRSSCWPGGAPATAARPRAGAAAHRERDRRRAAQHRVTGRPGQRRLVAQHQLGRDVRRGGRAGSEWSESGCHRIATPPGHCGVAEVISLSGGLAGGRMLRFHALGALTVSENGDDVSVGGPRQRRLVAMLLIHRNAVVSVDRLADAVFAGAPTPAASTTMRSYVARIRRVVDGNGSAAAVVTQAPGYMLQLPAETFDVACFERLVADAGTRLGRGDATGASSSVAGGAGVVARSGVRRVRRRGLGPAGGTAAGGAAAWSPTSGSSRPSWRTAVPWR